MGPSETSLLTTRATPSMATSPGRTHWGRGASSLGILVRVVDAALIFATLWIPTTLYSRSWGDTEWSAATVAAVLYVLVGQSFRLYDRWRGDKLKQEIAHALIAWFGVVVPLLLFLGFLSKSAPEFSRVVTVGWFLLAPTSIVIWRTGLRLSIRSLRKQGYNTRVTAIVGMTPLGQKLAEQIRENSALGLRLGGFFDDRQEERCHPISDQLGSRVGNLEAVVERARAGEIDLVYIALPLRAEPRVNGLLRKLSDTTATVYMAADFFAFDLLHASWGSLGDIPVVSLHETPFYGVDGWLKRLEDIVLGSMILALISIPMLIIGIGVRLSSKGPALYRQRRYGLNGEVIDVLKFRSMTVTETGNEITQATKDDHRITQFGAFLRRTSLDELPQFLNVVGGSMSIVGPRPHAVIHNELYRKKIQGYMLRHKVKPGITGWAQVNGWRGETDTLEKMEHRVEHDLAYIRNWSLLWDLQIILMTAFGSGAKENAY